jgi:hypothetical protein
LGQPHQKTGQKACDKELKEWHFNLLKIRLQNISATNPTGRGFERAGEFQSEEQYPQSWMSV